MTQPNMHALFSHNKRKTYVLLVGWVQPAPRVVLLRPANYLSVLLLVCPIYIRPDRQNPISDFGLGQGRTTWPDSCLERI